MSAVSKWPEPSGEMMRTMLLRRQGSTKARGLALFRYNLSTLVGEICVAAKTGGVSASDIYSKIEASSNKSRKRHDGMSIGYPSIFDCLVFWFEAVPQSQLRAAPSDAVNKADGHE